MLKLTVVEPGEFNPPPPVPTDSGVSVWRDQDGTISALCYRIGAHYCIDLPSFGRFRFGTPDEVVAVLEPGANPRNLVDAYRRHVLPLALKALGYSVLHASAVMTSRGVVALCASAKTGKSTFAHALGRRGYPAWADDAVALQVRNGRVDSLAIPFRIRLRREAAAFFSAIGGGSAMSPLSLDLDALPRRPLVAIAVLQRMDAGDADTPAAVRRLTGPEALKELLPQAYCLDPQDPVERRQLFEDYLLIAGSIPIFAFRFIPGFEHLDAVLGSLEQDLLSIAS